ncbi:hypothetical protein BU17DRAFT_100333 [Hysterangium stoloniferum]|nr:hypothetical protein BU17DRAFT_100333 [Hysterangium stoloniferum]
MTLLPLIIPTLLVVVSSRFLKDNHIEHATPTLVIINDPPTTQSTPAYYYDPGPVKEGLDTDGIGGPGGGVTNPPQRRALIEEYP